MTNERIYRSHKPRKCPACGFAPVGEILYGYPAFSEQLQADRDAGKVILGGCSMPLFEDGEWSAPRWQCKECGCEIYQPGQKSQVRE
ncbi:MAG: hypothetical protein ACPGYX_06525 [Oceanobacter sp.]